MSRVTIMKEGIETVVSDRKNHSPINQSEKKGSKSSERIKTKKYSPIDWRRAPKTCTPI